MTSGSAESPNTSNSLLKSEARRLAAVAAGPGGKVGAGGGTEAASARPMGIGTDAAGSGGWVSPDRPEGLSGTVGSGGPDGRVSSGGPDSSVSPGGPDGRVGSGGSVTRDSPGGPDRSGSTGGHGHWVNSGSYVSPGGSGGTGSPRSPGSPRGPGGPGGLGGPSGPGSPSDPSAWFSPGGWFGPGGWFSPGGFGGWVSSGRPGSPGGSGGWDSPGGHVGPGSWVSPGGRGGLVSPVGPDGRVGAAYRPGDHNGSGGWVSHGGPIDHDSSGDRVSPSIPDESGGRISPGSPGGTGGRVSPGSPGISSSPFGPGGPGRSGGWISHGGPGRYGGRVSSGGPSRSGGRVSPVGPGISGGPGGSGGWVRRGAPGGSGGPDGSGGRVSPGGRRGSGSPDGSGGRVSPGGARGSDGWVSLGGPRVSNGWVSPGSPGRIGGWASPGGRRGSGSPDGSGGRVSPGGARGSDGWVRLGGPRASNGWVSPGSPGGNGGWASPGGPDRLGGWVSPGGPGDWVRPGGHVGWVSPNGRVSPVGPDRPGGLGGSGGPGNHDSSGARVSPGDSGRSGGQVSPGGPGRSGSRVSPGGPGGSGGPVFPGGSDGLGDPLTETEEQLRRSLAAAEQHRKHEEGEKKKFAGQERLKPEKGKYKGGALGVDYDPEHRVSLDILHQELKARGSEVFYKQPQTTLTHGQTSDWLADPDPVKVDKSVKDSTDTARLHIKFEKKLSRVVKDKTPPAWKDIMQDVVIEAARKTAESFVATDYNNLVQDSLVSEMQKHGNEILIDVDGAAESHFFAAQRVKRKDSVAVEEPCYKVSIELEKKLDDLLSSCPMPRKLYTTMKEQVKETSKFLSPLVTKPDDFIEAYVALLAEMDAAGEAVLIEGKVPKTYKEAADYLRGLTTFKDTIGRPNKRMQHEIQDKLKNLMANAPSTGSKGSDSVMDSVIAEVAGLLVSNAMLQAEKAKVLDILVKEMQNSGEGTLLRHGSLLKYFKEGAKLLKGKTTDQLTVSNPDPIVARKIQIRLTNLMKDETPAQFQALMTEVIEEATMFLAVRLLEPQVLKKCKCHKNVFVQCELWCDEILRRVTRPCCRCSRHVSVQVLQDLAPDDILQVTPSQSHVLAPGVEITLKPCPYQARPPKQGTNSPCPAQCHQTTSYCLYETTHKTFGSNSKPSSSPSTSGRSPASSLSSISPLQVTKQCSPLKSLLLEMDDGNAAQSIPKQQERLQSIETGNLNRVLEEVQPSAYFASSSCYDSATSTSQTELAICDRCQQFSSPISETSQKSKALKCDKSEYSSRTPITSEEDIVDWDAMMVSLLWNVLSWRDWIQEVFDHALAYQHSPSFAMDRGDTANSWLSYYRRVTTEALQWRQYNTFSRQLTTCLHLRYKYQEIESPIFSTVKTKTYIECQEAILGMMDMFSRWTQWLNLVVKETESLQQMPGSEIPLHQIRWDHLKTKVKEYAKDWANYNMVLKVSWEQKYSSVIADYLPSWNKPGPVWVAGACGAVPSGAVAAGMYDGEVIWVARTMHRCTMLPATLLPSKHYCIVYEQGETHRYSKYQVLCNAEVCWVAWRGGLVPKSAVCASPGVHVGRVHYHGDHLLGTVQEPHYYCHVVIYGRPYAFDCYELLMLAGDDD